MRQILRQTWRLLRVHWPAVAAVLLVSWTLHRYGIELAAVVAVEKPALGWALLPLAILLFIAGYALVFRIIRGSLPTFAHEDDAEPAKPPGHADARSFGTLITERSRHYARSLSSLASAVILPFFIMWSAWGFFDEDMQYFASEVTRRFVFSEDGPDFRPDSVPIGFVSLSILVFSYLGKLLMERFEDRHPVFAVLAVYFEVLWVFFLAIVVFAPLIDVVDWIAGTALWTSITRVWYDVLAAVEPLRLAWAALVEPLADAVLRVARAFVLAIAWFALVGIVIGRPLSQPSPSRAFLERHPRLAQSLRSSTDQWHATPGPVRGFLFELAEDLLVRVSSLWAAFRALRRLGAHRIAFFVLSWVLLNAMEMGLTLGLREVIGPQTSLFWHQLYNPLLIIPWIVPEILRVCLLAATYDAAISTSPAARTVTNSTTVPAQT